MPAEQRSKGVRPTEGCGNESSAGSYCGSTKSGRPMALLEVDSSSSTEGSPDDEDEADQV